MKNNNKAPIYSLKGALFENEVLFIEVFQNSSQPDTTEFKINGSCPLLAEHFPQFPVVPASLIISFVTSLVNYSGRLIDLKNTKFSRPVVPNNQYFCEFRQQNNSVLLFTIKDQENNIYSKGLLCGDDLDLTHVATKKGDGHAI